MITRWFLPYDDTLESKQATWRAKEFFLGWYISISKNKMIFFFINEMILKINM